MLGFQPKVEKFHLEVGQPVFLPGQCPAIFIEYADCNKDRSLVVPLGGEAQVVFTLTLRPNRHLADKVLLVIDQLRRHESPAGMEHVVRALKKKTDVDNPFAVAWAMKKRDSEKNAMEGSGGAKTMPDSEASALSGASLRQVGITQTALTPPLESKPNRGENPRLQKPGGIVRK